MKHEHETASPKMPESELKTKGPPRHQVRLEVVPELPDQVIPFPVTIPSTAPPPRGGGGRDSGRSHSHIGSAAQSFSPKGPDDVVVLVRWLRRELEARSSAPAVWIEPETWFTIQLGRIAEACLESIANRIEGDPEAAKCLREFRKKRRPENREKSGLQNWRELQEIPDRPGNVIAFPSTFETRERWLAHRGACGARVRPAQRPTVERLLDAVQDALRVIQDASACDAERIGVAAVEALADWADCTIDKQPTRMLARLRRMAKKGGRK